MKISNITLISCYYELKAYTGIYTKSSVNLVFQKGFDVFILNYSCKILFMRKKIKKFWKYRYVSYVISVSLCLHLLFYICMWYEKKKREQYTFLNQNTGITLTYSNRYKKQLYWYIIVWFKSFMSNIFSIKSHYYPFPHNTTTL